MDSTMNENETTMMLHEEQDDYDEPIWKSKQSRSFVKQASYSRKNTTKFLDKDLGDRNRELYLHLFDQDPNETVCDKSEYEKELFADIKAPEEKPVKATKKRATKKKPKAGENPEFLSGEYQRKLEQQRTKLQEIFEQSSVFQSLQALKNTPLNIQTLDNKGQVVKRFQYFYDYEEDKHDIVEVKNNDDEDENEDDQMETSTSSNKRKNDNAEDDRRAEAAKKKRAKWASAKQQQQQQDDEQSEPATPNSRKRKMHFDDLNDDSFSTFNSSFNRSAIKSTSTPTTKRRLAKIDEQEETVNEEISKFDSNLADSDSEEEEFWVEVPDPKAASKAPAKSKVKSSNAKSSSKAKPSAKPKPPAKAKPSAKANTSNSSKANSSSKADKETATSESTRPRRSARAKK